MHRCSAISKSGRICKNKNKNKYMCMVHDDKCVICLENLSKCSVIRLQECNHILHNKCYDKMLYYSKLCPICRKYNKITISKCRSTIIINKILYFLDKIYLSKTFSEKEIWIQGLFTYIKRNPRFIISHPQFKLILMRKLRDFKQLYPYWNFLHTI